MREMDMDDFYDILMAAEKSKNTMEKWEYKFIGSLIVKSDDELGLKLNEMGDAGWEVVQYDLYYEGHEGDEYEVLFKRKKDRDAIQEPVIKPINDKISKFYEMKFVDMDVSVRMLNCLTAADIETVQDLIKFCKPSKSYGCKKGGLLNTLSLRNVGENSVKELIEVIKKIMPQEILDELKIT